MTALSRDEICSFINLIMTPLKIVLVIQLEKKITWRTLIMFNSRDPGLLSYLLFLISMCLGRTKTLT